MGHPRVPSPEILRGVVRNTHRRCMPIYEYVCDDCGHDFEALVLGSDSPTCPTCESVALSRKLSLPKVKSAKTHGKAMRAARKRDRAQGESQMRERIEYESSHDD